MTKREKSVNPTVPTKHSELTLERKARAWQMRRECKTQEYIARELGITQQAVSLLLKESLAEYKENHAREIEEDINEQLAIIDLKIEELERAWSISQLNGEFDTKYVAEIRALLADKRKIQGLEAPTKIESGGKVKVEFDNELKQLLDGLTSRSSPPTS